MQSAPERSINGREPRQHRPSVEASTIKEEDKQAGSKEAEVQELKTKEARNKPTESST